MVGQPVSNTHYECWSSFHIIAHELLFQMEVSKKVASTTPNSLSEQINILLSIFSFLPSRILRMKKQRQLGKYIAAFTSSVFFSRSSERNIPRFNVDGIFQVLLDKNLNRLLESSGTMVDRSETRYVADDEMSDDINSLDWNYSQITHLLAWSSPTKNGSITLFPAPRTAFSIGKKLCILLANSRSASW